jgi:hypothetical protein
LKETMKYRLSWQPSNTILLKTIGKTCDVIHGQHEKLSWIAERSTKNGRSASSSAEKPDHKRKD